MLHGYVNVEFILIDLKDLPCFGVSGVLVGSYLIFFIYVLTAIWLLPGGSTHLHTNNT